MGSLGREKQEFTFRAAADSPSKILSLIPALFFAHLSFFWLSVGWVFLVFWVVFFSLREKHNRDS